MTGPVRIGDSVRRVDGVAKVTGRARYTADHSYPEMLHGVLVGATVAGGTMAALDVEAAERAPGVELVLTAANRGPLGAMPDSTAGVGWPAESRPPLADDVVHYRGQCIAFVVAGTLERARYAADLITARYEPGPIAAVLADATSFEAPELVMGEPMQVRRGTEPDPADVAVVLTETYHSPSEHPCALEPHATVAAWSSDGKLVVHDSTQWVGGDRTVLAAALGLDADDVHVLAPFVGGMFGSKLATGTHTLLAAVTARRLGRPVAVTLTRRQVLTMVGHRSETVQRMALAARRDGTLLSMRHDTTAHAAQAERDCPGEFHEPTSSVSRLLYAVPHYAATHTAVRLNVAPPGWMRAPGEATGMWALESAMDELAYRLDIDPVELRIRNHARRDPHHDLPWSSKHLVECYRRGAEMFGWARRERVPRSCRDGDALLGWGMAGATYPVWRFGATVRVRLELRNGRPAATVSTAGSEVGNGAYTMLAVTAAAELGLALDRVEVELGDTLLPACSQTGGSSLSGSTAPAVVRACGALLAQLRARSGPPGGTGAAGSDDLADLLAVGPVTATGSTDPVYLRDEHHSYQSFGAHFVEVRVLPDIGQVRVSRVASVFDVGRVLVGTGVRAQLTGAIVFGIGQALHERLDHDPKGGGPLAPDLAGYLVPVHADIPQIDVDWIGEPDTVFSELGSRGAGEIGITGLAAAVANAVHHATGVRVRSLPIGPADLMAPPT